MASDPRWSPDGEEVLEAGHLLVPILTPHPLWLACIGEVLTWRDRRGKPTTLLTFGDLGLYDPDRRSHFRRVDRWAKLVRQDSVSRFRRYTRGLAHPELVRWAVPSAPFHESMDEDTRRAVQRLSQINLTSEGLSLTNSRFPEQLIPPEAARWMTESWSKTYQSTSAALARWSPDAVLVFNGRFVLEGAARGAALAAGIPVFAFDQGWAPNSITIYRNHVHDYAGLAANAEFLWARGDVGAHEAEAEAWLRDRIRVPGGGANSHSTGFASAQPAFDYDARVRIAVYPSSSDELFSIDTETDTSPEAQMRWLGAVVALADRDSGLDVHIRLHPNMAGKAKSDLDEWVDLASSAPRNVHVHAADSGVNSYLLAEAADLVLTFGSTITAEAAFLGRPVAELGGTHLSKLGVCSVATTEAELEQFVADPLSARRPDQRLQALKYAYWYTNNGDPLTFARLDGVDASLGTIALEPFGQAFRAPRRVYRHLADRGLPRFLQSRHGLASLAD